MQMLFGDGQPDMAHFAADRPLTAPPGERFNYSSGTSNIISGVVARTVGPGESYARFLHSRLFGPLGMTSADPEFDEAGTWVASSYLRASARDYARFGLLYLRDGMWDGVRILPAGWVDYGRTMVSIDDSEDPPVPTARTGSAYAARRSTPSTPGAPSAPRATRARRSRSAPRSTCMVVRLGKTAHEREDFLVPWRAAMVQAFAGAG